ncbi:DUF6318 family protein [Ornithinimicrobium pratense]|uniref:DUF6318 domain-containing protein n=1 Tax=Ornithinimicrobium pratense TaxID=2593973 RepID=A0A5J6V2H1_9MICO|nr:DUF6318 family protein [Ornithinimicrobium pratense]QFG68069.1 hypothetical protein FY030_04455 [Ornithinimicrobium pratense]
MRVVAIAAAAGVVLLAGCDTQTDPSPPPTTEDALTTLTATPTTHADDVDITTEAAPTTAEPTTSEPVADDGPPEMPAEAQEQTQAGAIAFAEHFVEVVNYTGIHPTPGLISGLSLEDCGTCGNLEATVEYSAENNEVLNEDLWEITAPPDILVFSGSDALVRVPLTQHELAVFDDNDQEVERTDRQSLNLGIDLSWEDGWIIRAVQVG